VLLDARDGPALERAFRGCERAMRARFGAAERRGLRVERWAEVRYRGQSHELSLPGGPGLAERFHREHESRFGFADRSRPVEIVTVEARGARPGIVWPRGAGGRVSRAPRTVLVSEGGVRVTALVREDEAITGGTTVRGPAVVTQSGATLWIPRGWSARRDRSGTLVVRRTGR